MTRQETADVPPHLGAPPSQAASGSPTGSAIESAVSSPTGASAGPLAGTTAGAPNAPGDQPAGQLLAALSLVEERVRRAVRARRADDPAPDDPFRGQYLTPEGAERLLRAPREHATPPTGDTPGTTFRPNPVGACGGAAGTGTGDAGTALDPRTRLGRLAVAFGLLPLDVELLLVALAPDIDPRLEQLYGYLNDDLTRRRPTIALALDLCGQGVAGPGRFRFSPAAPLVHGGLLDVAEGERPLPSRTLRVPDRVTAHLLGDDEPDSRLHGLLDTPPAGSGHCGTGSTAGATRPPDARTRQVAAALGTGGLVHLRDSGGAAGRLAVDALLLAGRRPLVLDVVALATHPAQDELRALPRVLATEARLSGGGIVVGPLEALAPERPERARLLRRLCAAASEVPVITHGGRGWDPLWAAQSPVPFTLAPPGARGRTEQWRHALAQAAAETEIRTGSMPSDGPSAPRGPADDELARAVVSYRLTTDQIRKAAAVATRLAAAEARPVSERDLRSAVRAQNGAGLERLARRIEPGVGWDDLVLPEPTRRQLVEFALRARHRERVLGQWRMRPGGGRGRGVIALFAGESGTGKTMSAEVVAAELGMDLYVVDLSTVVDKYIGETEKNLERIFSEASDVNGILLFDEADAVFGKRSQVKDAHDRHANVESAYLLQRMESFDGIAVLTTNLRTNLDEAFTRRLDVIAEFPVPDARQRRALWERCLGTELPREDGLDLEFCAQRFELAGGSIRACAVTAAYLAAEAGGAVGMAQVVSAVMQEYRKLGRLVLESEFGPWLGVV